MEDWLTLKWYVISPLEPRALMVGGQTDFLPLQAWGIEGKQVTLGTDG